MNNINKNELKIFRREHTKLNLDKKMLPLFTTPLILKKIHEMKKDKYDFKNPNPDNN